MIKNTELLTLLRKSVDTLETKVSLIKALHQLVQDLGIDFEYQDLGAYEKFLSNLQRVEKTSVGLYFPKTLSLTIEYLNECQELGEVAFKLSETNFIIGAFSDQMDEGSVFEENCLMLKSEMEFGRWYQYACGLAGFYGFDEYEKFNDEPTEVGDLDFSPGAVIDEVIALLTADSLITQVMRNDDRDELIEEIEDSLF